MVRINVKGFLLEPKRLPDGDVYSGRVKLPGVQWTGSNSDLFATVTVTADQLADAADNRLLWTDQSVQRGLQPTVPPGTPRELAVADGYPNRQYYIFDYAKADEIASKLLHGERLFLSPLVWNLRPGRFTAHWAESESAIYLYSGKVYLPDSHHRHQAIIKAVRTARDSPDAFPTFSTERQFKVELYFLDREAEGDYFFDKNQRPKPVAKSKAYDLSTQDDLSVLAKRVLEKSPALNAGVNRVTDRLSRKAPYFMTLSTLREVMRTFAGSTEVEEAELDGLAVVAAEFFDMLADVRPELRVGTPHQQRDSTLAAAAVMMHGYGALMSDYALDLGRMGRRQGQEAWSERLARLSPSVLFHSGPWRGDFFSKHNPLWLRYGIMKEDPDTGRITTFNSGGTRARAARILRSYLLGEEVERAVVPPG